MTKELRLTLILVCASALLGCATSYQPEGFTGGFTETQLDKNVFKVSFKGNAATSEDKAADFALLRAAELSLKNGFDYFVIVDSENYVKNETYTAPATAHTTASVYGTGNSAHGTATTTISGGQTHIYSKPRSTNTIICFKERPEIDALVYDASFVVNSIRSKHEMFD